MEEEWRQHQNYAHSPIARRQQPWTVPVIAGDAVFVAMWEERGWNHSPISQHE
jgi:hypothetical protein